MKRLAPILAALAALALLPAAAGASFGFKELDVTFTNEDGSTVAQAGAHPFAMTTKIEMNGAFDPQFGYEIPEGAAKNLRIFQVPGLAGNPTAMPRCSSVDFLTKNPDPELELFPSCPDDAALGVVVAKVGYEEPLLVHTAVYNLQPPPGVAAKIGFRVLGVSVTTDLGVSEAPPYEVLATLDNIPQPIQFFGATLTLWGNPAAGAHDLYRGTCVEVDKVFENPEVQSAGICQSNLPEKPFLTLPRACAGPLATRFEADSWQSPGAWVSETAQTHDGSVPPNPLGMSGCTKLAFAPRIGAQLTSASAQSPSGLDFDLEIGDEGLTNPSGIAGSDIRRAVVTLPEGVTINPAQAEGLAVCSEADLARERAASAPGAGCPQASKVGTVEVQTPLLEGEILRGSVFVAEPYENRFGSLIALYMTIKSPSLGIALRLAGKVEPDPRTGQLIAGFDDLPQLPFSHFHMHLREGARSPLATPPRCGTYTTEAILTPYANPRTPYTATSSFGIASGPGGRPCPAGGAPPFEPGFSAGTLSNAAGRYSPFLMRLTRRDGDQDLTRFSATLPPGMVARLAGTSQCPDQAIALARSKSGKEEQAAPSCPAGSRIGRVLAGAGVGSELTYVPGEVYLAGPTGGAPLSVVAIVPAVAGPFDVGTVVTRQALRIDPRTAKVSVDGAASDPIPHILKGIPLAVRDIRVAVDRPEFTLNPTSCEPFAVGAELWGGGSDVFSSADDAAVSLAERFQAAGCAALGFKPRLSLRLKGGTKRGDHPALRGVFRPRPGDANLRGLVLRLPRSAFLEQAHIRTICTRVQFAADACPRGAIYGSATAYTPLLDQPLSGPVYLRSSNNNLPDFVADLHGTIDVEAVARIDSKRGGIRATFTKVPDAPLTKVVVKMQGGKKGLIVNSRNLCHRSKRNRAKTNLRGQNGRRSNANPVVRAVKCKKKRKRAKRSSHRRARLASASTAR